MTADELRDHIKELGERWAPFLQLNDYELRFAFDEIDDTANADTQTEYVTHTCNFNIGKILWKLDHEPDFDLEEYVVHELIHVYTARLWGLCQQLLVGKDMQHAWHWVLGEYFEEATQRMSNALIAMARADRA